MAESLSGNLAPTAGIALSKADTVGERIAAFHRARGSGVIVQKTGRGYSLFSARTGAPIARLRPTDEADKVQVLWWNGKRWGASGPFGIATMPLDYIADESDFWIHF